MLISLHLPYLLLRIWNYQSIKLIGTGERGKGGKEGGEGEQEGRRRDTTQVLDRIMMTINVAPKCSAVGPYNKTRSKKYTRREGRVLKTKKRGGVSNFTKKRGGKGRVFSHAWQVHITIDSKKKGGGGEGEGVNIKVG